MNRINNFSLLGYKFSLVNFNSFDPLRTRAEGIKIFKFRLEIIRLVVSV